MEEALYCKLRNVRRCRALGAADPQVRAALSGIELGLELHVMELRGD